MPRLTDIVVHEQPTNRSAYRYQFTPKHHGLDSRAAQWLPELTLEEEFRVFNTADDCEIVDERGWMYGVLRVDNRLQDLGTWHQQIAEFPQSRQGESWHGYPLWTVNELAPENRRGESMRPDKAVFKKLESRKLLTKRERKRLVKGDHA